MPTQITGYIGIEFCVYAQYYMCIYTELAIDMKTATDKQITDEVSSPVCINLQMMRSSHFVLKTYDEAYRPHGVRATQMPVQNLLMTLCNKLKTASV